MNVTWSIFVSSIHENWSDMTILFYYTYNIPFLSIKPYIPSFAYLIRPLQYMYVCFRYIRGHILTQTSSYCGKHSAVLWEKSRNFKKSQNKGRLSYHLWVEFFSQLSFDSEVYTQSATAADFVYISESNESCEKHSTQRLLIYLHPIFLQR